MSGYVWDDANDGSQNQEPAPSPRDLRKQLEDVLAKLKEKDEQIASLREDSRASKVKDAFTEAGLPPKAMKLFPKDQDPTPEAVKAFVEEFGDLFGKPAGGATGAPVQGQPQTSQGQQTQITTQTAQVDPFEATVRALAASLRNVTTGETGVTTTDVNAVAQQQMLSANQNATDLSSFLAALRAGAAPVQE